MKKLFVTMLTILTCGAVYALPVGNPSDASLLCDGLIWEGHCGDPCDPCISWCDAISVRIGFYGDYVFNRHLEVDRNEADDDIEHTSIYTNAGLVVVNFFDRVDFFGTFGGTNLWIDTNAFSFGGTNGERVIIETDTDFSWSAGVRGSIWECGCTTLGIEAQYFYTKPHIMRITERSAIGIYPANSLNLKYREWQVGVGISHRINMLVPYLAVKWSHCQGKADHAVIGSPLPTGFTLHNLQNKKDWGFAAGVSLVDCEKVALTVEGRWADEKALFASGEIRF